MSTQSINPNQPTSSDQKIRQSASQTTNQVLSHPYVQQAGSIANDYLSRLDSSLGQYPALNSIEEQTRVPKVYGVLGLGGATFLLIFFNLLGLASPISNLIGWAAPAYFSIGALESPGKNDDKQWLTYWVIFGLFNLAESLGLRVILYYFPFYFVIKTLLILWLMNPSFRGAELLYHSFVRKVYLQTQAQAKSSNRGPAAGYSSSPAGYQTTTSSLSHEKTL